MTWTERVRVWSHFRRAVAGSEIGWRTMQVPSELYHHGLDGLKNPNGDMLMKDTFKRFIATVLIVCTTSFGVQGMARAQIVGTDEAQATLNASAQRDRLDSFLARDDVRQDLVKRGVDVVAARERVGSLTDAEVAALAGRIDQAPAGGDVVGVIFTVFIVLLLTDILGWTKVFPFTRPIR